MDVSLRWMLAIAVLAGAPIAHAAVTTQPAAAQQSDRQQQIRRWFVGLTDADPNLRDESRRHLLGLTRADLPGLRAAVQEFRPVPSNVAQELKRIVTHVYLAEAEYEKSTEGFIGLPQPSTVGTSVKLEIVVESPIPGFAGFRYLREGDAIVDMEEHPLTQPADWTDFCRAIAGSRPGQMVHLKVLRQGKIVRIPVVLDARPTAAVGGEDRITELLESRSRAAANYWNQNFAPLLGDKKPAEHAQSK